MSDDKTEEPTEHKLRTAREEGQVVKSQDVVTAATAAAVVVTLLATAGGAQQHLRRILSLGLEAAGSELGEPELYRRMGAMATEALSVLLPVVAVGIVAGIAGVAAQVGLQITPKSVSLKFDAINPASGIKKVFSLKSLLSFAQMLVKAVLLGVVLWQATLLLIPLISISVFQTPETIAVVGWSALTRILEYVVGVFAIVAPLDYALQRHQFMKGQRMTKDEIKREFKSQEGDPLVKGQRRQIAFELAQGAPQRPVARADAVIVNPTHYAVAVRYRAEEQGVPIVLCKGLDDEALAIRREAEALGVPVFAHPPLARALHEVPVDAPVPDELFEAVAVVLRWVRDLAAMQGGETAPDGASQG